MRKFVLFMAFAGLCLGCSNDDEIKTENENTPILDPEDEWLVEGSPWRFEDMEVLEIIDNSSPPNTKEKIEDMAKVNLFIGTKFSFDNNGTGSFTSNSEDGFNFYYDFPLETTLDYETISFEDNTDNLENVVVTENKLEFTWKAEVLVEGNGQDPEDYAYIYGRFTYKTIAD